MNDWQRVLVSLTLVWMIALASTGFGQHAEPDRPVPTTGAPRQLWPQRPGEWRPFTTIIPDVAVPPRPEAALVEPQFVPNEVLVQFEPNVAEEARATMRATAGATLASPLRADGRLERLTTTLPVRDAVAILQGLPQVEFAEPNWIVSHHETSNDPLYTDGTLWGMQGADTLPANPFGSGAAVPWARGLTGSSTVYVAVIDEGIDYTHPDLAANIWTNPFDPVDGIDNDGNGKIDDVHGWDFLNDDNSVYDGPQDDHGTHVAGTIGARGGNGIGVAGVAWNVTIISAKFLAGTGSTDHAVLALDYLIDLKTRHGLNIIATNNSWGGSQPSQALHQAMIRAAKQGILFITSAGNGGGDAIGDNNDVVFQYPSNYSTTVQAGTETPATYEAVIAVAALTSSGERASFSNYGAATVDIGAPGSGVWSTWPGGQYQSLNGTSMAAPHVTGAAVLYAAAYPGATAAEIRSAILQQGIETPSMASTVTGKRLNVGAFDPTLQLSINDVRIMERFLGTKYANFTVSLSAPSSAPVTVNFATQNRTAVNGDGAETASIAVPSTGTAGSALPYPSSIVMPAGLGPVVDVRVTLHGLTHSFVQDVDVLLVGPGGQSCVLMSDVGSGAVANQTFTFVAAAPAMPIGAPLSSGTYRPTNSGAGDLFGSPAPPGPHGASLSVFTDTSPVGSWRLYIVDDGSGGSGSVVGGWSLALRTYDEDYVSVSGVVTFPAGSTRQTVGVPVHGDARIEPAETFAVVLSGVAGAALLDAEGIGTIVNDDLNDPVLDGLPIKAMHVLELRTAINELRVINGLSAFAFTDPTLTIPSPVRAIHITELRDALDEAYLERFLPPRDYTDPTLIPGVTVIKAAHITQIRHYLSQFSAD